MAKKPTKKKIKKKDYSREAIQKKVVDRHQSSKPNKEIGRVSPKGTVKVKNITEHTLKHWNGVIFAGKSGLVTPYEADLYRRKKLAE